MEGDPRAELASIAASVRAYLEWQRDSGAVGTPRGRGASQLPVYPAAHMPTAQPTRAAAQADPFSQRQAQATTTAVTRSPPDPETTGMPAALLGTLDAPPPARATPAAARAFTPRAAPRSLEVIAADAASCTRCGLSASRSHSVFFRGNAAARLCLVGDAPGPEEDAAGKPFVGPAGVVLDRMIRAMGLDPGNDVYVCGIIKCKPAEGHKVTDAETAMCLPFLHEQIDAVSPKVIVALGNTAVGALIGGSGAGISKMRGEWKLYRGRILVMPTYHPAYLERPGPHQRNARAETWRDLQKVMSELQLPPPTKSV